MLKYNPKTNINQGIKKFVNWYVEAKKQDKLFEN
jgi:dTDP-D-glucose 4,6-dehydratase